MPLCLIVGRAPCAKALFAGICVAGGRRCCGGATVVATTGGLSVRMANMASRLMSLRLLFLPSPSNLAFVRGAVRREFAQRHRGALLGRAWVVLQPAAMIAIYTLVFSRLMHGRLPGNPGLDSVWAYSVFLCAGLLPWGLFAETLGRAQNGFFDQAHLLRKTAMPLTLPALVGLGVALGNFLLIAGLFLVFLAIVGLLPGWVLLWALPALVLQTLLALGLGLALGAVAVFFRDAAHLTGLGLQFGFWFTPIVYPLAVLPAWAQEWVLRLNPMAPLVLWYQTLFLEGRPAAPAILLPSVLWTLGALGAAVWLLRRRGGEIPDLL